MTSDEALRVALINSGEALDRIHTNSADPRLHALSERIDKLTDYLPRRDKMHRTVLDRMREFAAGIPAQHYGPRSRSGGGVSEEVEDELSNAAAMARMFPPDRASLDLRDVGEAATSLCGYVKVCVVAAQQIAGWKLPTRGYNRLNSLLTTLERVYNYPDLTRERGPSELHKLALDRENIRSAPDCPSCARIKGFACACRESVNGRGEREVRAVCEFCERWAKRDEDPENPGWPLIYLVVQHHREDRAKLLDSRHAARSEMEAWAKKHRTKGAAA